MPLSDNELKARMKAQADAAIERLFAEKKDVEEIKLSDIEQAVWEAGDRLKADLTAGLVEQVSRAEPQAPGPVCTKCGQEMHYKGQKAKQVMTETGEVTLKRAYYYCETCQTGVFPPG